MWKNEEKFAEILKEVGLEFVPQVNIRKYGVVKARIDFYLPKYALYCEVVSTPGTLDKKVKKLGKLIKEGYKIAFYRHTGQRIMLDFWTLENLGLQKNSLIPTIPEIENGVCTISGRSADRRYANGRPDWWC
jgi:hypothetical protein